MQFKAKDGSVHGSQKKAFDASQGPAPAAAPDAAPKSIEDDPQAMQLVDQLKQMGYTADDVAQAMGDVDQGQDQGAGQGAPLAIPGMQ